MAQKEYSKKFESNKTHDISTSRFNSTFFLSPIEFINNEPSKENNFIQSIESQNIGLGQEIENNTHKSNNQTPKSIENNLKKCLGKDLLKHLDESSPLRPSISNKANPKKSKIIFGERKINSLKNLLNEKNFNERISTLNKFAHLAALQPSSSGSYDDYLVGYELKKCLFYKLFDFFNFNNFNNCNFNYDKNSKDFDDTAQFCYKSRLPEASQIELHLNQKNRNSELWKKPPEKRESLFYTKLMRRSRSFSFLSNNYSALQEKVNQKEISENFTNFENDTDNIYLKSSINTEENLEYNDPELKNRNMSSLKRNHFPNTQSQNSYNKSANNNINNNLKNKEKNKINDNNNNNNINIDSKLFKNENKKNFYEAFLEKTSGNITANTLHNSSNKMKKSASLNLLAFENKVPFEAYADLDYDKIFYSPVYNYNNCFEKGKNVFNYEDTVNPDANAFYTEKSTLNLNINPIKTDSQFKAPMPQELSEANFAAATAKKFVLNKMQFEESTGYSSAHQKLKPAFSPNSDYAIDMQMNMNNFQAKNSILYPNYSDFNDPIRNISENNFNFSTNNSAKSNANLYPYTQKTSSSNLNNITSTNNNNIIILANTNSNANNINNNNIKDIIYENVNDYENEFFQGGNIDNYGNINKKTIAKDKMTFIDLEPEELNHRYLQEEANYQQISQNNYSVANTPGKENESFDNRNFETFDCCDIDTFINKGFPAPTNVNYNDAKMPTKPGEAEANKISCNSNLNSKFADFADKSCFKVDLVPQGTSISVASSRDNSNTNVKDKNNESGQNYQTSLSNSNVNNNITKNPYSIRNNSSNSNKLAEKQSENQMQNTQKKPALVISDDICFYPKCIREAANKGNMSLARNSKEEIKGDNNQNNINNSNDNNQSDNKTGAIGASIIDNYRIFTNLSDNINKTTNNSLNKLCMNTSNLEDSDINRGNNPNINCNTIDNGYNPFPGRGENNEEQFPLKIMNQISSNNNNNINNNNGNGNIKIAQGKLTNLTSNLNDEDIILSNFDSNNNTMTNNNNNRNLKNHNINQSQQQLQQQQQQQQQMNRNLSFATEKPQQQQQHHKQGQNSQCKTGWVCSQCRNFNYESKCFSFLIFDF